MTDKTGDIIHGGEGSPSGVAMDSEAWFMAAEGLAAEDGGPPAGVVATSATKRRSSTSGRSGRTKRHTRASAAAGSPKKALPDPSDDEDEESEENGSGGGSAGNAEGSQTGVIVGGLVFRGEVKDPHPGLSGMTQEGNPVVWTCAYHRGPKGWDRQWFLSGLRWSNRNEVVSYTTLARAQVGNFSSAGSIPKILVVPTDGSSPPECVLTVWRSVLTRSGAYALRSCPLGTAGPRGCSICVGGEDGSLVRRTGRFPSKSVSRAGGGERTHCCASSLVGTILPKMHPSSCWSWRAR
jgi:hypothetical protein